MSLYIYWPRCANGVNLGRFQNFWPLTPGRAGRFCIKKIFRDGGISYLSLRMCLLNAQRRDVG